MAFFDFLLPKWKRSDPEVRINAVLGIKDQVILSEVAQNDKDRRVREIAKQRYQDILYDIATGNEEFALRTDAVSKLRDQKKLASIAEAQILRSYNVCVISENFGSISTSGSTMKRDLKLIIEDEKVCLAALEMITEETLLYEVVTKSPELSVKEAALRKITDPKILTKICKSSVPQNIKKMAGEMLGSK